MPMTVTCDCGKKFRLPDDAAGKRFKCPECGEIIQPGGEAESQPAVAAPVILDNDPQPKRPSPKKPQPRRTAQRPSRPEAKRRPASNPRNRKEQIIAKLRREMSEYYHEKCKGETGVSDDYLLLAALDPWCFGIGSTECGGCGSARMKDCVIEDGRTLHQAFVELRQTVPTAGVLFRFVMIPFFGFVLGALAGAIIAVVSPNNVNPFLAMFLMAVLAASGAWSIKHQIFKELRRMGAFW